MTVPLDFYLEQAAKCGEAAAESQLPTQREIFLRSQLAWQAMVDRKRGVLAGRTEREPAFAATNQGSNP